MIIPCYRCGKELESPNASNADYIIAGDTIVREPRETFIVLRHNSATLAKQAMMEEIEIYLAEDGITKLARPKYPDLRIDDKEYDVIEIPNFETSKLFAEDLIKVISELREKDIQKTGIICPGCYKDTDFVIWGVHEEEAKTKGLG